MNGDYKFIWANIGANGSASDAQVFGDSDSRDSIRNGENHIPAADPLPSSDQDTHYFIIGDDAFPLWT